MNILNILRGIREEHPDDQDIAFTTNRTKDASGAFSQHIDLSGKQIQGNANAKVYKTRIDWLSSEEAQFLSQLFPLVNGLWKLVSPVEVDKPVEYSEADQVAALQHFFKDIRDSMEESPQPVSGKLKKKRDKRIILYIPGIFHTLESSIADAALVAKAASRLNGAVIVFDWATRGIYSIDYNGARQKCQFSVPQLAVFLYALIKAFPDCTIHTIAHSHGCNLLMQSMQKLELLFWETGFKTLGKPLTQKPICSAILIAADIWTPVFAKTQWESATNNCQHVYAVCSKIDRVVRAGSWYDMCWVDRLGQLIPESLRKKCDITVESYDRLGSLKDFPVLDGLKGVDASAVDDKLIGHLLAIMVAIQIIIAIMMRKSLDQFQGITTANGRPDIFVYGAEMKTKMRRLGINQSMAALMLKVD